MKKFYFVFGIYFQFNVVICVTKYFLVEQGNHFNIGNNALCPLSILLLVLDCIFYLWIYELLTLANKKIRMPSAVYLSFFIGYLFVNAIYNELDILNATSNFQIPAFNYFRTYMHTVSLFSDNKVINYPQTITSSIDLLGKVNQGAASVVLDVFKTNSISVIICGTNLFVSIILIILLCIFSRKAVYRSFKTPQFTSQDMKLTKVQKQCLIVVSLLSVADILLFLSLLCNTGQESKVFEAAAGIWCLWKSLTTYTMKEEILQNFIREERDIINLQEDIYYIDNRDIIQFPYIVGTKDTYCKFNNCDEQPIQSEPISEKDIPNIVLVMVESFSSNPLLLKDQKFVVEQEGSAFNDDYLPNLSLINQLGSTNIGVNSLGFPTILGWFGIQTGNVPLRYGIGMTQQRRQEHLTLAKFFKNLGYSTAYTSSAPPEFDGKQNILYNGDFENVQYYKPTEALGFKNFTNNSWVADRITQEQFQRQINNISQPFFANWFTIDTHQYWNGYDQKQFYNKSIEHDYVRMANYFDQQLGTLVNFLKVNFSNTIIIITGDHGPRWAINPADYDGWDYECASKTFNDEYFGTSATTAYLGENEALNAIFNLNRTYNSFTDINSYMLQIQKQLTAYLKKPLVTNRVPTPISLTHRVIEVRVGGKITRSYFYDYSKRQEFSESITCRVYNSSESFTNLKSKDISKDNLHTGKRILAVRNAISAQNRMWHDAFLCQERNCDLPNFTVKFDTEWDYAIYSFICVPLIGMLVGCALIVLVFYGEILLYKLKNFLKAKQTPQDLEDLGMLNSQFEA
ncbi:Sulfatase [Spironucleus salmonicida]|uniref:Sulfatase n=1 Tax=Spironucleus salmonicida TaxID=348837 RepID=V6LEV4_9EUKA|nr:Sulfatase [Spironucleus salmonicida]|eukprot:EST42798.1 Sulfatase [Spironucleus salmonicida]